MRRKHYRWYKRMKSWFLNNKILTRSYLREDDWATLRLEQLFILHHLIYFCGKVLHRVLHTWNFTTWLYILWDNLSCYSIVICQMDRKIDQNTPMFTTLNQFIQTFLKYLCQSSVIFFRLPFSLTDIVFLHINIKFLFNIYSL